MRLIKARYPGKCGCGSRIQRGGLIGYEKGSPVICADCYADGEVGAGVEEADDQEERDWPPSPSVLASDRSLARRGLTVVRFPSGAVMTQNSRGRCIDAPCCGCCS